MDKVTDWDAARKSIDSALKNLYMSRIHLKQSPDWPIKIKRMEYELFNLLGEIESKKQS